MKCKHTGKKIISPLDKLNKSEPSVGVKPNVISQSLHVMQVYKFTFSVMVINHGVDYTFYEYNDYPPIPHEEKEVFIIAHSFANAVEILKDDHALTRNMLINKIIKVERIDNPFYLETTHIDFSSSCRLKTETPGGK